MVSTALMFLASAVLAASFCKTVLASLYPTMPVSDTVYRAGHEGLIMWTDSEREPHLDELSSLKIKLFTSDGIYVSTLATDVEPYRRRHLVNMPTALPAGPHNYMLRFSSINPNTTTYTADFVILPESSPTAMLANVLPAVSSTTDTRAHGYLTLVLPNATITSQVLQASGQVFPAATVSADPFTKTGYTATSRPSSTTVENSGTRGSRPNLDNFAFRFIYVLWPAIVGICMAL